MNIRMCLNNFFENVIERKRREESQVYCGRRNNNRALIPCDCIPSSGRVYYRKEDGRILLGKMPSPRHGGADAKAGQHYTNKQYNL